MNAPDQHLLPAPEPLKLTPRERLGIKVTAAVLGVSALTGCSFGGGDNDANSEPIDTLPYVQADALGPNFVTGGYAVDVSEITATIQSQPDADTRYTAPENINPATNQDTYDLPSYKSAPVLTITLGQKNKLIYEDTTPGISTAERGLLTATQANEPVLVQAMRDKRIDSIRFRVFQPNQTPDEPDQEPTDQMLVLPKDYTDGDKEGKPNMYYFLKADGRLDMKALDAMMNHEGLHGALRHAEQKIITPEQGKAYEDACNVLRQHALQDMKYLSVATTNTLGEALDEAPDTLKPIYANVIEAMENGTYGDLPTEELEASEVPKCYIQHPVHALQQQAVHLGLQAEYGEHTDIRTESGSRAYDFIAKASDEWNDTIEEQTVYKYLKEANWLPPEPTEKAIGHPQDGMQEVTVSTLNRLMKDPDTFGMDIASQDTEVRSAITTIIDLGTQQLRQFYPDAHDLHQIISERRTIFDKQLVS